MNKNKIFLVATTFGLFGSTAFAAGFEKATTWSGRYNGIGAAAVSSVSGSQALYFNPAGLARGSEGGDVSLNFSPTFAQFEAPINRGASYAVVQTKGNRSLSPVFGGVAGYKLNSDLGVGAGMFVSGGSKASYENLEFVTNPNLKPNWKTELAVAEVSVGAGYNITPELSVGASWRYSMVRSSFAQVNYISAASTIGETTFKDLEASNASSFRVGTMYRGDDWGVGLNFRSAVNFTAKGTTEVRADGAASATVLANNGKAAELTSSFPLQLEIGGDAALSATSKLYLAYGFSQYSKNQKLGITVGGAANDVILDWKDQHHVRLGYEYTGFSAMPLRAGYVFASQVTPKTRAGATLSSPSIGNVVVIGSGYSFSDELTFDFAGEFSMSGGKGEPIPASGAAKVANGNGDYSSNSYVFHTGLNYKF